MRVAAPVHEYSSDFSKLLNIYVARKLIALSNSIEGLITFLQFHTKQHHVRKLNSEKIRAHPTGSLGIKYKETLFLDETKGINYILFRRQ